MPPQDLVPDVARALGNAHRNVFEKCARVSGEWAYREGVPYGYFQQEYQKHRSIPMKHKTLQEALVPQPAASEVFEKLLDWIDRVDLASQNGRQRPPFIHVDGSNIFPASGDPDERWWLTELTKHKEAEKILQDLEECPGSSEEDLGDEIFGEIVDDKNANEETSDSESEAGEDTLESYPQTGALLPLDRARYHARKSYEDTPSLECP